MNDVTKNFYTSFLNYISQKEIKKLYSNLSKHKLFVKGFPPNKLPPTTILAPQIAKSEKAFFDILKECYTPTFNNRDDATKSFTPDIAVTCLTYFVKIGMPDESFLMSLLEKKEAIQEKIQLSPETGKAKKKTEEFRVKYLSAHRELQQLKKDYKKLQVENTTLKSELSKATNTLNLVKETFRQNEEKTESIINQLKSRISELEDTIIKYQPTNTAQEVSTLIIMDIDRTDNLGIDILTYDNISKLFELADKYDEILLVINDLPFSIRRKIHKIETVQGKVIKFSTKQEMLEYVKQRRNG